jgi:low affinity Fe/Cu permease
LQLSNTANGTTGVISASYLKSDGVLAVYSIEGTNSITHVKTGGVNVTREGLPTETTTGGSDIFGWLQHNILYVGIGVAVIVVLGVVVCLRRK